MECLALDNSVQNYSSVDNSIMTTFTDNSAMTNYYNAASLLSK